MGLAGDVKLTGPVKKGQILSVDDIAADRTSQAWQVRDSMTREFGPR
jgi:predicted homoserine dehydrogenase-like protein